MVLEETWPTCISVLASLHLSILSLRSPGCIALGDTREGPVGDSRELITVVPITGHASRLYSQPPLPPKPSQ